MHVQPEVLESADEVGRVAALQIAGRLQQATEAGRAFVLGCPSGRSPLSTYRHLARLVSERRLDLGRVVIALMDEYLEQTPRGLRAVDPGAAHSCVGFARERILAPLNAAAAPGHELPESNLWWPDPASEPGEYDRALAEAGGVDVFLLASGASDGHVALNPAGSSADSVTRVVAIGEPTRRDNLGTFPSLRSLEEVPEFGVTVGIATIRDLSRSVVMIATGAHKRVTVRRLAAASAYEPDWPATVLSECASPRFLADREAAALLAAAS